jgi:hypothetical protein
MNRDPGLGGSRTGLATVRSPVHYYGARKPRETFLTSKQAASDC